MYLTWSGGGEPRDVGRGEGDLGLDEAPCPSSPELTFLLLRGLDDVTLNSSA